MGEQGRGGHRARRKLLWLGGLGAALGLTRGAEPAAAGNREPLQLG
jgi:hypothetical protein